MQVAVHRLHQTGAACGKIEDHLGHVQLKPLEVDDVDVRGFSNLKRAAVAQPVNVRRRLGLLVDHKFEREFPSATSPIDPMGQEVGGKGCITDQSAVRAAVG